MTVSELLTHTEALGIHLVVTPDSQLKARAPKGTLTPELTQALSEHKEELIAMLTLPPPVSPGPELTQLRREIGEMVRAEEEQYELSDELDPAWPPSAGVRKRIRRKDNPLQEVA